jgi:hypothetical protein
MEPLRFNPFNQIHKGLRALLYHTALSLQHTNFTSDDEVNDAVTKLKEVIYLFEGHAHTEDTLVFPLLKQFAPHIVAEFEQQHVKDHELGCALEQALELIQTAAAAEEKINAAFRLQLAFTEFAAFNLSHMNQEETIVKEALWKHFSDAELLAVMHKIVAAIPPEKNARYSFWMLKGLSLNEIVAWYKGIKAGAPPFVFDQMMALAEASLSEVRYTALQIAVEKEAVA